MPGINVRLNFDQLRALSEGDPAFMNQILNLVLEHSVEVMENVDASLAERNFARLKEVAHKYKSSINILSDAGIQKLLKDMENEAEGGQGLSEAPGLFPGF